MRFLLPLLFLSALTAAAPAQDIVAVTWGGDVYGIDSTNGVDNFIGSSGTSRLNSMARDGSGTLYTFADGDLYTIDPGTGTGTFVVSTSLSSVRGAAFDSTGRLYVIEDGSPDALYVVDPGTGSATFIGGTGYFGIQALTDVSGRLYAWECGSGGGTGVGLVIIDKATGATTDVGTPTGQCSEVQTLAVGPSGRLYGAKDTFYGVNLADGSLIPIGGSLSDVRGMEFTGGGCSGLVLDIIGPCPGMVKVDITCATPNGNVAFATARSTGSFVVPNNFPCAGTTLGLSNQGLTLQTVVAADAAGNITFQANVPASACGRIFVQAIDLTNCNTSNVIGL